MAPVAEEELGPVKFLLGVIDRNVCAYHVKVNRFLTFKL